MFVWEKINLTIAQALDYLLFLYMIGGRYIFSHIINFERSDQSIILIIIIV